jgi:hypothetical protein
MTWRMWHTSVVLLCLAFLVALPIAMAEGTTAGWLSLTISAKYVIWALILVDVFIIMVVAGLGITGRTTGLLIDERNRMSTSRFQLVIWTLVIVPALLAFFYINIALHTADATNIAVPAELWILLGISGGAAIGAPVVNDATNRSKTPKNAPAQDPTLQGILDVNETVDQANFEDIFEGDELGNRDHLDISKMQMVLITIGLALGYGYAILALLANASPTAVLTTFPPISSNLAILLAVSQGTYLSYKAAPHTPTKKS